jgi:hypothetical protein
VILTTCSLHAHTYLLTPDVGKHLVDCLELVLGTQEVVVSSEVLWGFTFGDQSLPLAIT